MADEITRDIARQARREDLEDRTKMTTMSEIITGRSAGFPQVDILARTFAEDMPYRMRQVGERESTNVEDRRFVDDPVDPNAPLAVGPRVAPGGEEVVQRGTIIPLATYRDRATGQESTRVALPGIFDDIWESMKRLQAGVPDVMEFNPKDTLNVAGAAMTGGMGRLATAEAGGLGSFGGRLGNKATLTSKEGLEYPAREVYSDPKRAEFRIAGPEGRKVGEYSVTESSVPGKLTIDNVVVNPDFRRQGIAEQAYDSVIAQVGKDNLTPSATLQEATYQMWKRKNPAMLEAGNYVKEADGVWVRMDDSFSTVKREPRKALVGDAATPDQGVMKFGFEEGGNPAAVFRREMKNRLDSGQSLTARPPPEAQIDISAIPDFKPSVRNKMNEAIAKETDSAVAVLKKEMPDLQFEVEKSGRSSYVYAMDGDKTILKVRLSDHGATRFDSLSIDPVSGNTLETVLQALRFERGLTDVAPEVGWSFAPSQGLRDKMNAGARMTVFPSGRQIGGTAEYVKGGYQSNQTPYSIRTQEVGKDIQWRDPALVK